MRKPYELARAELGTFEWKDGSNPRVDRYFDDVGFPTMGEPQPVPLDLISRLMLRCDEDGKLLPPRILKAGDAVEISGGPFAEFVATVEKVEPERRVWVLLELMGRTTRVAVHPDALRVV